MEEYLMIDKKDTIENSLKIELKFQWKNWKPLKENVQLLFTLKKCK